MKVQFDIKYRPQIESGEYKVVTGDDRPVRIISWGKRAFGGHTEIVALVPTPRGDAETVQLYCPDGTLISSGWNEKFKLFLITPDPELTEFEQAVRGCIAKNLTTHGREGNVEVSSIVYIDDETTKKLTAELLDLARKQLIEEQYTSDPRKTNLYKLGKAEALKDLPRWKKAIGKERLNERAIVFAGDNDLLCTNYAVEGEYYISFSELEKLPKEE